MKGRGDRPARVGERIREELSLLLLRRVNDPGVASVTVTEIISGSFTPFSACTSSMATMQALTERVSMMVSA